MKASIGRPAMFCLVVATLAVTGCATKPTAVARSPVLDRIDKRMEAATAAQTELATVVAAAAASPKRLRRDVLTDRLTMDYVGDVEVVLQRIAKQYSFGFEVLGKRPPEGLMVNIYIKKATPVIDILKAVAYQYPTRIDVNVTETSIELVYKKG